MGTEEEGRDARSGIILGLRRRGGTPGLSVTGANVKSRGGMGRGENHEGVQLVGGRRKGYQTENMAVNPTVRSLSPEP